MKSRFPLFYAMLSSLQYLSQFAHIEPRGGGKEGIPARDCEERTAQKANRRKAHGPFQGTDPPAVPPIICALTRNIVPVIV